MAQTAYKVNGHIAADHSGWFECVNCGARLMTLMQYNTAPCRPKESGL